MKPHWFHILLALTDDDRHGADIAQRVRAASTGTIVLWPVTLYGSLSELEEQGWIASLSDQAHPRGQSERRKYYRLTRTGRQALTAETKRLAALVSTAERRLHPKEAT